MSATAQRGKYSIEITDKKHAKFRQPTINRNKLNMDKVYMAYLPTYIFMCDLIMPKLADGHDRQPL